MYRLILLVMYSSSVLANSSVWVDDNVKIPMRTDASFTKGNIISSVPIKSEVVVVQTNESGWSEVEFDEYKGWMVTRYLTDEPFSNPEAEKLSKKLLELQNELAEQKSLIQGMEILTKSQQDEIDSVNIEIYQSEASALRIDELQNNLRNSNSRNDVLVKNLAILKGRAESLYSTDLLTLITTIALIVGLVIGVIFNRASIQKVHSMYSI